MNQQELRAKIEGAWHGLDDVDQWVEEDYDIVGAVLTAILDQIPAKGELARCKFCRGEAEMRDTIDYRVVIRCTLCKVTSKGISKTDIGHQEQAIQLWNRNALLEQIMEGI